MPGGVRAGHHDVGFPSWCQSAITMDDGIIHRPNPRWSPRTGRLLFTADIVKPFCLCLILFYKQTGICFWLLDEFERLLLGLTHHYKTKSDKTVDSLILIKMNVFYVGWVKQITHKWNQVKPQSVFKHTYTHSPGACIMKQDFGLAR